MHKLQAIYVDLDGVLCDMVGPALEIHQRQDLLAGWPKGVYDLEKAIGITMDEFWAKIDEKGYDFWANLPAYEWMRDLMRTCYQYSERVVLCSKPSRSHYSSGGKHQWIAKHFGRRFRDFIITPQKYHAAGPNRLLIDDCEKNIIQWQRAGGMGLLFPQPWNSGSGTVVDVIQSIAVVATV